MKRIFLFSTLLLSVIFTNAEEKDIKFHINNGEIKSIALERIDSVMFDDKLDLISLIFEGRCESFSLSSVDSINFGYLPTEVAVTYFNDKVIVENPYAFDSVAIDIIDTKVVVSSSTEKEIDYRLQGNCENGCFKIYAVKKYDMYLNGLTLTNKSGAAFNSQCKKRASIVIEDGTTNSLSDATTYQYTTGEDEKATIFSEGQIIFEGNGELFVTGNNKHAICSDDYIEINSGSITVTKSASDAIHTNDSLIVNGGNLSLTAGGDGMDCDGYVKLYGGVIAIDAETDDVKGIKSGKDIFIDGANINVTIKGDASKGIKSGRNIEVLSGELSVTAIGNTVLLNGDPSYATCIKCDSTLNISGGTILLEATGVAGRGISADGEITIVDGTTTITCSGDSETYDPAIEGGDTTEEEEKSYIVYVSVPTSSNNRPGASSSRWGNVYLYENSGTLIATLSNKVTINNTQFYYYDFGTETTGTYYFKSDDYSSFNGTYAIQSGTFTGIKSDKYYQIQSSYQNSTDGSARIYSLSDVTSSYEGGSVSSGSSTENSYNAVGIKCDGNFNIYGGEHSITISGSESKGIKVEQDALFDDGRVVINTSGIAKIVANDPSYCTAIKSDGKLTINSGVIEITATGQGGMGISSDGELTMNGGDVNITISGAGASYTATTGTDYYSTKCIKGDVAVNLLGGKLNCISNGNGSKGVVAGGLLTIGKENSENDLLEISVITKGSSLGTSSSSGGNWGGGMKEQGFNAAPKAIKGAANVIINSGKIYTETANDGGEGIESKAIMTINGGIIECNTYDDCINASSALQINCGYLYCRASNNDGIDSNGTITINDGIILSSGSNSPEEGFDCDQNQFVINGGIIVGTGGATSSPTSAKQPYASVSSVSISQGKYISVKNNSGNVLFSYKCPNTINSATVLLSSPDFTKSSHTLVYGVTSVSDQEENLFDGIFLIGGAISGGSSKSFTPQTK